VQLILATFLLGPQIHFFRLAINRAGINPISAKLFYIHSQDIEQTKHRTSNLEHRIMMSLRVTIKFHRFTVSDFSSFPVQRSMLDVRCSMFIFLIVHTQKQLSIYGVIPAPVNTLPIKILSAASLPFQLRIQQRHDLIGRDGHDRPGV